jgi:hypothetical protein
MSSAGELRFLSNCLCEKEEKEVSLTHMSTVGEKGKNVFSLAVLFREKRKKLISLIGMLWDKFICIKTIFSIVLVGKQCPCLFSYKLQ